MNRWLATTLLLVPGAASAQDGTRAEARVEPGARQTVSFIVQVRDDGGRLEAKAPLVELRGKDGVHLVSPADNGVPPDQIAGDNIFMAVVNSLSGDEFGLSIASAADPGQPLGVGTVQFQAGDREREVRIEIAADKATITSHAVATAAPSASPTAGPLPPVTAPPPPLLEPIVTGGPAQTGTRARIAVALLVSATVGGLAGNALGRRQLRVQALEWVGRVDGWASLGDALPPLPARSSAWVVAEDQRAHASAALAQALSQRGPVIVVTAAAEAHHQRAAFAASGSDVWLLGSARPADIERAAEFLARSGRPPSIVLDGAGVVAATVERDTIGARGVSGVVVSIHSSEAAVPPGTPIVRLKEVEGRWRVRA